MNEFLRSTDIIDWKHSGIQARARSLAMGCDNVSAIARQCFEWVRDEIKHSHDHGLSEIGSERVTSAGGTSFQVQSFAVASTSVPTSSAITLREATSSDINQLAEWNHHLIREEGHRNRMTVPQLAERMRGWLKQDYRATVFELAGTPVAYALFREQPDEIYLRQLFVVREHRRERIGKQAIELLRTKVWPTNKRLTVEVLTANTTAVAFWQAVGFADYSLTLEILPPE